MRKTVAAAAALAALGSTAAVAGAAQPAAPKAPATQAATRQYEGTIVSVNRSARTFRLRDSERGTVTIKVTSNTRFQRVGGFSGLRAGMTRIEANVRRSNGAWVATFVERSGGGGNHGGGNGGGSDD
jgi:hypothetical protein